LNAKKRPSPHHDLPATHHNFTTKTPPQNTIFLKNPLQKRPSHHKTKKSSKSKKTARQESPDRIIYQNRLTRRRG
jgi:hypothetical protein